MTTSTSPAEMIGQIYNVGLMIGGILAVGFVIWGGARYIFNAGNPSGTSAAKDNIYNALIGLVLLLGAYIILHTINPSLTSLTMPELQPIPQAAGTTGGSTSQNAFTASTTQEKARCGGTVEGVCSDPNTHCYNLGTTQNPNRVCLTADQVDAIERQNKK